MGVVNSETYTYVYSKIYNDVMVTAADWALNKCLFPKLFKKVVCHTKTYDIATTAKLGKWSTFTKGDEHPSQELKDDLTKQLTPLKYGLKFSIHKDDVKDAIRSYGIKTGPDTLFGSAKYIDRVAGFGSGGIYALEEACMNVFVNGYAGSAGPDGVVLFSASHPIVNGSLSYYSNLITGALSFDTLATIDLAAYAIKDPNGLYYPSNVVSDYKYLMVGPSNKANAERLMNSTSIPGKSDNDVNPYYKKYEIVINPFFVGAAAARWGILKESNNPSAGNLKLVEWDPMEITGWYEPKVQTHSFAGDSRFNVCWLDGRDVIFSTGA